MPANPDYRFAGFTEPRYTPIPDVFFDEIAPNLSEAELRVALYVMRRTFGFKKTADAISLAQLTDGITTSDGRVLDSGTGMSKSAVWRGAKGLVEKGVLTVEKRLSDAGDNDVNIYQLRFREGVVLQENHGSSPKEPGVVLQENPQETVNKKQENNTANDSNDRAIILDYVQDFSREFADSAPLKSSMTRVYTLYTRSGLSLDQFISALYQAREKTRYATRVKHRMPYFMKILETLVLGESN